MKLLRDAPRAKRYTQQDFSGDYFLDLNLYQCGQEACNPFQAYGPAIRQHFLFHYVLSGAGCLETSDQSYQLTEDQGFLISPGRVTTYTADGSTPWEYCWLEFDGLRAREMLAMAGLGERMPVFTPVSHDAGYLVRDEMLYIVDHPGDHLIRLVGHGMIFLDQLVLSSSKKPSAGHHRLRDYYIQEALNFIENNYQRNMSIEELASACGLNRNYFSRIFKDSLGQSPQQYLLHYRMTRAMELLKGSRLSIRDVGIAVGYENQLHFSRAFKSVYGTSPREYRQNNMTFPE